MWDSDSMVSINIEPKLNPNLDKRVTKSLLSSVTQYMQKPPGARTLFECKEISKLL